MLLSNRQMPYITSLMCRDAEATKITRIGDNKNVEIFFALTLIIGAIGYVPWVLASYGLVPQELGILVILGGISPTIAAVIVAYREYPEKGMGHLFGAFKRGGFSRLWFLIPLLLPFLTILAAIGLSILFGGDFDLAQVDFIAFFPFLLQMFLMNVWEEIGWRGYALPNLQSKYNAFVSSMILGFMWSLWHWPHFALNNSQMALNYGSFLFFVADVILVTILYTWLYNSTNGNLLIASLIHAARNAAGIVLLASTGVQVNQIFFLVVFGVIAIVLTLVFKPESLSHRKRVSFEQIVIESRSETESD